MQRSMSKDITRYLKTALARRQRRPGRAQVGAHRGQLALQLRARVGAAAACNYALCHKLGEREMRLKSTPLHLKFKQMNLTYVI